MTPIVPAIIPKSAEDLKQTLAKLPFVHEVQIDVVDGKFVPFTSWPYSPSGIPKDLKTETDKFTIEIDLMVKEPVVAATAWLEAGADMLVFHIESLSLERLKMFKATTSVSIGVSALNDTPLEVFLPYIEVADYVQLMGISQIGTQGQGFDERVLERIIAIKTKFKNKLISIDGSVNKNTILALKEAGADRFVTGSAILSAENPQQAYLELYSLIN